MPGWLESQVSDHDSNDIVTDTSDEKESGDEECEESDDAGSDEAKNQSDENEEELNNEDESSMANDPTEQLSFPRPRANPLSFPDSNRMLIYVLLRIDLIINYNCINIIVKLNSVIRIKFAIQIFLKEFKCQQIRFLPFLQVPQLKPRN